VRDRDKSRCFAALVAGVCLASLGLVAAAVAGRALALSYPHVFMIVAVGMLAVIVGGVVVELSARFYTWRVWRRVDRRIRRELFADVRRHARERGVQS